MPVKVFRNKKFSTTHENKIFDELIDSLKERWENSSDLIILLGNFYCAGTEIDSLVVKRDSISVIDFKNYGGKISFSENSAWKANGVDINGNPYLQIQHNKFQLLNFLKQKQVFKEGNDVDLGHISGIVVFHQSIEFDKGKIPQKSASWFHVTDILDINKLLYQITSRKINLSDDEILKFPEILDLKEYEFERPKVTIDENKFQNTITLVNELSRLEDIQRSIEFAEIGSKEIVKSHDQFLNYFYTDKKPEKALNYNLSVFKGKYDQKRSDFIKTQTSLLHTQIEIIYNLNSNNGFVLDEFTKNKELKDALKVKSETSRILRSILLKYKINLTSENIPFSTMEATKDFLYGRAIFDENLLMEIGNIFTQKDILIKNLHAIYVLCRYWFADDIIMHGLELDKGEVEHVYARGFSERWKKNIEKRINNSEVLNSVVEKRSFFTESEEKNFLKFPELKDSEINSCKYSDIISEIEIPKPIREVFSIINSNLESILGKYECNLILEFLNIGWISKKALSINDLYVIDLRTHYIFNLSDDFDFLANKNSLPFHYFPNQYLFEPIYITLFEHIGGNYLNTFKSEVEFNKSYKNLSSGLVTEIDKITGIWELYKPQDWYYTYDSYYFNNRLNIGSRDNGTDYKGTNVSKELKITPSELESFLHQIKNEKLFGNFYFTGIGDKYYIQALKNFKCSSKFQNLGNMIDAKKASTTKSVKSKIPLGVTNPSDQKIIGYNDIKQYIEHRLEPYKDPIGAEEFGLKKIAGILLYGPPGCGKTYWASWISKYLELPFEEIYRSQIGSIYVDGAMNELEKKLNEIEKKAPIAIFFDEFDSIGKARESRSNSDSENSKVVNTLLQRISKLIEKGIVVLAATNFINDLDSAVIRPGRFDLHIPIFPPMPEERSELIVHYLTENSPQAIHEVLSNNEAVDIDFWQEYSDLMYLFSVSHVKDFCNELKSQIHLMSKSGDLEQITLSYEFIIQRINIVKTKIRKKDVELYIRFFEESNNLFGNFRSRMERLKFEIDKFNDKGGKGHRPVGFKI